MTRKDAKSIATEMLVAWTSGDFARTRALVHDDATFDGPLGETRGGDRYVEGVRGFAKMTTRAGAVIPTVGIYRVEEDMVRSVRAYFDPRPIVR
jgi:ketosteroid isomerase-like protein